MVPCTSSVNSALTLSLTFLRLLTTTTLPTNHLLYGGPNHRATLSPVSMSFGSVYGHERTS